MARSMVDDIPRWVRLQPVSVFLMILLIPTLVLSIAAAGTGVLSGDVAVTLFIQTHTPAQLAPLYDAVNWIGTTAGAALMTLVIGLVLMLRRQPLLAALILLTFPIRALNALLKAILESPRPPGTLVSISEHANGFGFPSGHVMGATILYGAVFILAPYLTERRASQRAIRVAAIVMIALAGVSRIYVGAHWPSDVVGAYLWGLVVLVAAELAVHTLPLSTR